MIGEDHVYLLALALIVDAVVGDPDTVWRRAPHPVAVIGALIGRLDRAWNRPADSPSRRAALGAVAIVLVAFVAGLAGYALERLLLALPFGWVVTVLLASILLAGRSLHDHVAAVAAGLGEGLARGRVAVARIVGRDPDTLDAAGVSRAAIESAAENFADGFVAPALWFLVLGLPGMFAYKAINTADSMIGHTTPEHRDFGRGAARLDDLANWPGSRLAGVVIALAAPLAGGATSRSLRVMMADAAKHRSPNAGWPEAAMAGALGVALAGPRRYSGVAVNDPFLNEAGRHDAGPEDIRRALAVYRGAWAILAAAVAGAATFVLM